MNQIEEIQREILQEDSMQLCEGHNVDEPTEREANSDNIPSQLTREEWEKLLQRSQPVYLKTPKQPYL